MKFCAIPFNIRKKHLVPQLSINPVIGLNGDSFTAPLGFPVVIQPTGAHAVRLESGFRSDKMTALAAGYYFIHFDPVQKT